LVVAVDGDRPGRLEAAIRDALPSPNRLDAADAGFVVVAAEKEEQRQEPTGGGEETSTEYRVLCT